MVTLVLGGARSGKSEVAERLAVRSGQRVIYLAPGEAWDEEMTERIRLHQERRPAAWTTVEEPLAIAAAVRRLGQPGTSGQPGPCFLLDGLGTWVSNLLLAEQEVLPQVDDLLAALAETGTEAIIVSDEVGLGVVPATPLGRQFRDILGRANQMVAARADRALLVVAGLAIDLKALAVDI